MTARREPFKGWFHEVMAVRQNASTDPVSELAEMCRTARNERGLGVAALAKQAKVGGSSIITLENKQLRKQVKTPRDWRTWTRILAQVALTLRQDPRTWLGLLGKFTRVPLSDEDLRRAIVEARRRLTEEQRGADQGTLAEIRARLRESEIDPVPVRACLLTCGDQDRAQRSFYTRLVERVLRALSPRLTLSVVEPEVKSFQAMMEGLRDSPPQWRMVVGPWSMVARSTFLEGKATGQVAFTSLPLLRHRLACLVAEEYAGSLSWDKVRSGAPDPLLQVITVEGEAGDVYLRSYCGFQPDRLSRVPEYNMGKVAAEIAEKMASRRPTVLVIGEYEARTVSTLYTSRNTGRRLVDLAAREGAHAPTYQLAIATAEADARWTQVIGRAIRELFSVSPNLMAEVYADYVCDVISESLQLHSGRPVDEVFNGLFFTEGVLVPGYLQLSEPGEFPVPPAFKKILGEHLSCRLRKLFKDPGEQDRQVQRLIQRIVPWLIGPEEKLDEMLQSLRHIERLLAGVVGPLLQHTRE